MSKLTRLEQFIFYLLIIFLPIQTRVILFNWAPQRVGFNEWTSAFLQATDVLILGLLILWFIRCLTKYAEIKFYKADAFLLVFFTISMLSITASNFRSLSFYQLIKLAEFIAFYFYIKSNLSKVFSRERLLKVLVLSGLFQAIVAILQYSMQSALGLKIFGESPITPGGYGVASFYVGQTVYLRAYGLMPHPNILAVFLMLCLAAFWFLYFNKNLISFNRHFDTMMYQSIWPLTIYTIMLYAFFATYSRTVIGVMVLAVVVFLVIQFFSHGIQFFRHKKVYILAIVTLAVILLFVGLNFHQVVARVLISGSDEAISLRLYYNKLAGQTTGSYPWFGVGIGAFVPKLMQTFNRLPVYFYQPVHNIYLLISSETGLFGLTSFLAFLFFLIRSYIQANSLKNLNNLGLLLVVCTFLAIGLFDHLLWTIQQGRILFWLALALTLN